MSDMTREYIGGYGFDGEPELTCEEVVRCRDCAYSIHFLHHDDERWQCAEPHQEGDDVKPDAYCWRGKRKEGGGA